MGHHTTAIIHPTARLGREVEVGPFSIIGADVEIGDNTHIGPHVYIADGTIIGQGCHLHNGAVVGSPPQHRRHPENRSGVRIGDRNEFREYVTVHGATDPESGTIIGDDNYFMAYSHLGHDAHVGNGITMANMVQLGGHVIVEDGVVIGGLLGVHQFVRIGKLAMVGGLSRVTQDIPPFMITEGHPARVVGVNVQGLRRGAFEAAVRQGIQRAYRLIYRSNLNLGDALRHVSETIPPSDALAYLVDFLTSMHNGGYAGRQNDPMGNAATARETVGAPKTAAHSSEH